MTTTVAPLPPVPVQSTPMGWLKKNLFSTKLNTAITVVLGLILLRSLVSFGQWTVSQAQWRVLGANLMLFMMGRFPLTEQWRIWMLVGMLATLGGLTWGVLARQVRTLFSKPVLISVGLLAAIAILIPTPIPNRLLTLAYLALILGMAWVGRQFAQRWTGLAIWIPLGWTIAFFVGLWLMAGGLGLRTIETNLWGGLLLTMFMAIVSIVLSFPFGLLLALGRQSSLPAIKGVSTFLIEVVRGTPLTALLFLGDVMVPMFLPGTIRPDRVVRAIIGLTFFCAAYTAETVRGGLQAIPRGQTEAANALGLNTPLSLALVILPQALKISIPAIVGLFIQMVQETTLVSILGLQELLGISRSILANPEFLGRYAEVYLFIGFLYWAFCYAMSLGSRRLEQVLNVNR